MHQLKLVALGDCNTLGVSDCKQNSYPERVGRSLGAEVVNLGHTMATTREARHLLTKEIGLQTDILLISLGLTDSWRGLKLAPYVLYYPDNLFRRLARKLVKRIKKTARQTGLNGLIGVAAVTPPKLYLSNLTAMIESVPAHALVLLIDILPKAEEDRNVDIVAYNRLLDTLPEHFGNVRRVRCYDFFYSRRGTLFQDNTHLNDQGCDALADMILDAAKQALGERKTAKMCA